MRRVTCLNGDAMVHSDDGEYVDFDEADEVEKERDALKAEVERLTKEASNLGSWMDAHEKAAQRNACLAMDRERERDAARSDLERARGVIAVFRRAFEWMKAESKARFDAGHPALDAAHFFTICGMALGEGDDLSPASTPEAQGIATGEVSCCCDAPECMYYDGPCKAPCLGPKRHAAPPTPPARETLPTVAEMAGSCADGRLVKAGDLCHEEGYNAALEEAVKAVDRCRENMLTGDEQYQMAITDAEAAIRALRTP